MRSSAAGVELVGRLVGRPRRPALFSGGLRNQFALADLKMERLLDTFDDWARTHGRDATSAAGALRADARAELVTLQLDLRKRRDPIHRLGHRVSPGLQLARRAGPPSL